MATEKNITMKQFNGTDYDTLYPKTKVEQVEGAYSQQQILADSTKGLYGLGNDAVPDDVLALIKTLIDNGDASANQNANSRAKISSGSYTGTNNNKTMTEKRFTASFPIKVVIVSPNDNPASLYDAKTSAFAFAGTSTTVSIGNNYGTYNFNQLGTKYNYVVLG